MSLTTVLNMNKEEMLSLPELRSLDLNLLMLKAQCLYGLPFLTAILIQLIMLWNFLIRLVFYVHQEAASEALEKVM